MTIDQMMAEIRETWPEAWIYEPRGLFVILGGRTPATPTLGRACERYEAVYSALKAVRKARPKPMTVGEARKEVLSRVDGSITVVRSLGPNGWEFYIETGPRKYPAASTEGQAWKAAAAAIQAEGKGNDR